MAMATSTFRSSKRLAALDLSAPSHSSRLERGRTCARSNRTPRASKESNTRRSLPRMILFHATRVGVIAAVATTAEGTMLSRIPHHGRHIGRLHSVQCGPGFLPSRQLWRRYISSPQVELHVAKKSLTDFQPPCVNRTTVTPPSLEIFHVSVVPAHSGCSPWQLQTTSLPGSSFSTFMRKTMLRRFDVSSLPWVPPG